MLPLVVGAAGLADVVLAVQAQALGVDEEGEGRAAADAAVLVEAVLLGEDGASAAFLRQLLLHLTENRERERRRERERGKGKGRGREREKVSVWWRTAMRNDWRCRCKLTMEKRGYLNKKREGSEGVMALVKHSLTLILRN